MLCWQKSYLPPRWADTVLLRKVVELQPEPYTTVIDTDIEVGATTPGRLLKRLEWRLVPSSFVRSHALLRSSDGDVRNILYIQVDLDVPEDQQQAEADAMATSMSQGSPDRAALGNTLGASGGAKLGGVSNSPPKVGQSLGSTLGGSAAGRTTGGAAMSQEVRFMS